METIKTNPSFILNHEHLIGYNVHAGYYQLGSPIGLKILSKNKPNWFHRTMMRICWGIVWVDHIPVL